MERRGGASKMTKRAVEIEDLLVRLRAIEKEMPQDQEANGGPKRNKARVDRFVEAKTEFLQGMTEVKDSLKDMKGNQTMTRTRDQIARAQQVRGKLKDLSKLFQEMELLYSKETRKRKSKVPPEELEMRAQFLQQFKSDLEALKRLSSKSFSMGNASSGESPDLELGGSGRGAGLDAASFFKSLPEAKSNGASASGFGGTGTTSPVEVELTGMEQERLQTIKSRDAEFDLILDQIGLAVEMAGQKANAIHDEAELQNAMLDKLEENIEKTQDKINTVNMTMKKSLDESGGAERFCINCMCFIFLLGIIGLIVNVVA